MSCLFGITWGALGSYNTVRALVTDFYVEVEESRVLLSTAHESSRHEPERKMLVVMEKFVA